MPLNEILAERQMTAHTNRTALEVQCLKRSLLTDSSMIVAKCFLCNDVNVVVETNLGKLILESYPRESMT